MRILFLTKYVKPFDGYGRYSIALRNGMMKEGHKVKVLVSESSGLSPENEEAILESPQKYISNPLHIFEASRRVQKKIELFRPDLIHCLVEPYAHILSLMPQMSTPIILTVHGTYAFLPLLVESKMRRGVTNYFTERIMLRANAIIAVSAYTKRHLLKSYRRGDVLEKKTAVIHNGVDVLYFKKDSECTSEPRRPRTVLLVGVVAERKGVKEAIYSLKRYQEKYGRELKLRVVGSLHEETTYVKEVLALLRDLRLENSVHFTGRISEEELFREYREAAAFLLPAVNHGKEFEGFGLVYLEANAFGLPVVGVSGSGAEEAIADGESGFLVRPGDVEAIADKLHSLVDYPDLWEKMSGQAIRWAESFVWEKQIKLYEEVYRKVLQDHPAP
mgnify:CR=1 FL=1